MKKFFALILFIVLVISLTACTNKSITSNTANSEHTSSTAQTNETTTSNTANSEHTSITANSDIFYTTVEDNDNFVENKTPESITDLFDGEKKVWFYIDHRDSYDGLAYDSDVKAVFTTENKTVTSMYYNLIGISNNSLSLRSNMVGATSLENPNPFTCERLQIKDFKSLSDDDIIEKVSSVYADASKNYSFKYYTGDYNYEKCEFPCTILYYGFLDNSGNKLESESIRLFDRNYFVNFPFNDTVEQERLRGEFPYEAFIRPIEILDKSYIGIKDGQGNMIITENIYGSINSIGFDDPNGITEW